MAKISNNPFYFFKLQGIYKLIVHIFSIYLMHQSIYMHIYSTYTEYRWFDVQIIDARNIILEVNMISHGGQRVV